MTAIDNDDIYGRMSEKEKSMKSPSLFWARLGMYYRDNPSYYRVVVRSVDKDGIMGEFFYEEAEYKKGVGLPGFFPWRDIISMEIL